MHVTWLMDFKSVDNDFQYLLPFCENRPVRCVLLALEATHFCMVTNELQRTYFKRKSALKTISYICNCKSFSCVSDPLQSAQIHENATKSF